MTIIGADLSRYDDNSAADDYAFVILNVEDPGMADKAELAHAAGVPVWLYSWVYPGDNGYSITRAYAAEDLLAFRGVPVAGHLSWLDHEEAGVTPQDLRNAAARRVPGRLTGVYSYLAMLNQYGGPNGELAQVIRDNFDALWIAYYPEGNDGHYPASSDGPAREYGAKVWQFTSTNGSRDLNVILDEEWYASIIGGTGASEPEASTKEPEGGDNMLFVTNKDGKTAVFIRQGRELWVRGFDGGAPQEPALLTDKCAPHNFDLELTEGFGLQVVWAVADEPGKLIRCNPTDFGPIAEVV